MSTNSKIKPKNGLDSFYDNANKFHQKLKNTWLKAPDEVKGEIVQSISKQSPKALDQICFDVTKSKKKFLHEKVTKWEYSKYKESFNSFLFKRGMHAYIVFRTFFTECKKGIVLNDSFLKNSTQGDYNTIENGLKFVQHIASNEHFFQLYKYTFYSFFYEEWGREEGEGFKSVNEQATISNIKTSSNINVEENNMTKKIDDIINIKKSINDKIDNLIILQEVKVDDLHHELQLIIDAIDSCKVILDEALLSGFKLPEISDASSLKIAVLNAEQFLLDSFSIKQKREKIQELISNLRNCNILSKVARIVKKINSSIPGAIQELDTLPDKLLEVFPNVTEGGSYFEWIKSIDEKKFNEILSHTEVLIDFANLVEDTDYFNLLQLKDTTEVKENIPAEVKENIPAEVKENIPAEVKENIPAEVKENIPAEVKENIPAEVKENNPTECTNDVIWSCLLNNRPDMARAIYDYIPGDLDLDLSLEKVHSLYEGQMFCNLLIEPEELQEAYSWKDTNCGNVNSYLLASAAIIPAIAYPYRTSALTVVRNLDSESFKNLEQFRKFKDQLILLIDRHNIRLKNIIQHKSASSCSIDEGDELSAKARDYLDKMPKTKLNHINLIKIWNNWLTNNGLVGKILNIIIQKDFSNNAILKETINKFKTQTNVGDLLKDELATVSDMRDSIGNHFIHTIHRKLQTIVNLVNEFIAYSETDKLNDDQGLEEISHFLKLLDLSIAEMASESNCKSVVGRSLKVLLNTLENLKKTIHNRPKRVTKTYMDFVELFPEVILSPNNKLVFTSDACASIYKLLDKIPNTPIDYERIAIEHANKGNIKIASIILDKHLEADSLENIISKKNLIFGKKLSDLLIEVRFQFNKLLNTGVWYDAKLLEDKNQLDVIENVCDSEVVNYPFYFEFLNKILEKLKFELQRMSDLLRSKVEELNSDRVKELIIEAIDSDYLDSAWSYFREYQNSPETFNIDSIQHEDNRILFNFLEEYDQVFGNFSKLVQNDAKVKVQQESENDITYIKNTIAPTIKAWYDLESLKKKSGNLIPKDTVKQILSFLGFNYKNVNKKSSTNGYSTFIFELEKRITQKEICRCPFFGSQAKQYHLLVLTGHDSKCESIISLVKDNFSSTDAVLFFNLEPMDKIKRNRLAKLSRSTDRTFLVLDRIMLIYIMLQLGDNLTSFFSLSLPFTKTNPYKTTAGLLQDVFYGRQKEIASIINPDNTNLLYGGRQLGKTALLEYIEKTENRPELRILYLDLKDKLSQLNDFWKFLGNKLYIDGISCKTCETEKSVRDAVIEFTKNKRLVILLDEADQLIKMDAGENDSNPRFNVINTLRDLGKNKNFKFVLSGLHNVQRMYRSSNSSFGHLGSPITIGPLFESESIAAQQLIVEPLLSLGYTLSKHLVIKILEQTNYYPSLIQIYCHHLLNKLYEKHNTYFKDEDLPYVITEKHLNEVYNTKSKVIKTYLQKEIRGRFRLTLDLDPRYHLIALIIANHFHLDRNFPGLSQREVFKSCKDYWVDGFKNIKNNDQITTLLDEMVDLGVLRYKYEEELYTLRNINLLPLIGSKSEVENDLIDFLDRQPVIEFDMAKGRMLLDPETCKRHPLTFKQIHNLEQDSKHNVVLISGSKALGIYDLPEAMKKSHSFYISFIGNKHFKDLRDYEKRLEDKLNNRKCDKNFMLVIIQPESGWEKQWLNFTIDKLNGLKIDEDLATIHVLFILNPERLLNFDTNEIRARNLSGNANQIYITLNKWSENCFKAWCDDMHLSCCQKLESLTGLWPSIISLCYIFLREDKVPVEELIENFDVMILNHETITLESFGVNEKLLPLVQAFCEYGEQQGLSEDELEYILTESDFKISMLRKSLSYCEELSIINLVPDKDLAETYWQIDPIIKKVFEFKV